MSSQNLTFSFSKTNVLYVSTWKNDYSNAFSSHIKYVDDRYILLMKWFMNWRLAKFSCAQMIMSAFPCLDRGGHPHTSGNQQNFALLSIHSCSLCFPPHSPPTLPGKFIAGSGRGSHHHQEIMCPFTCHTHYTTHLGNKNLYHTKPFSKRDYFEHYFLSSIEPSVVMKLLFGWISFNIILGGINSS